MKRKIISLIIFLCFSGLAYSKNNIWYIYEDGVKTNNNIVFHQHNYMVMEIDYVIQTIQYAKRGNSITITYRGNEFERVKIGNRYRIVKNRVTETYYKTSSISYSNFKGKYILKDLNLLRQDIVNIENKISNLNNIN